MAKKVRVRFAPSPTGGLHLGGVRTVLYNYLFARHHGGEFILRIEDTDQSRYVPGAEEYIYDTLEWCGLVPDESPRKGGAFGPYRQSERKELYRAYAERLVDAGRAYYAFDTPEDLDAMRTRLKTDTNPTPQYDHRTRTGMRNSLTLPAEEVKALLDAGTPHVVRIHLEPGETVTFTDMIRGDVSFDTALVDDKVLLKADGMPTYHLAVVVDDHLMEITHAFRGEEWLPSAPVHVLLWRWLFGEEAMPQWAHLPLILGPSGKLSKRDGAKYGFPVFAMNWTDPKSNELTEGFRERGFLPEAFVNLLALLGWNDGTEQELFSLEELVQRFQMEKVHKGGAQFNFEKAQWFNHEWIKRSPAQRLLPDVKRVLADKGIPAASDEQTLRVIDLVKERCTFLTDFPAQAGFFFEAPRELDTTAFIAKWTPEKKAFFEQYAAAINESIDAASFEATFKAGADAAGIKPGELQLPLRIMLVGGKFGPPVFAIAEMIGAEATAARIRKALDIIAAG
ncbi:MAG: glutamate--tRNA ligase [Chitinophagaceae bacterium]|nr:MAG: glutamate--tRNA ligase [Chitinophagaceae bacterium]